MIEKTIVFIDAGFLSKLSKELGKGKYLKYDLFEFCSIIVKKEKLELEKIYYYNASPFISNNPTKEEIERKEKYDNFTNKLRKNTLIEVKEGRCQRIKLKNGEYEYNQKGVDTLLTIDMTTLPLKYPHIKKIILIACDSDFVPVIKEINKYQVKTLLYTYYEKGRNRILSTSNQLFQVVSKYELITIDDFNNAKLNNDKKVKLQ